MTQKHTQEPWQQFEHEKRAIVSEEHPNLSLLSIDDDGLGIFFEEKDARRVVACVNACAGVPTELLEDSKCWAEAGIETATYLRKQCDELLAALQSISKITGDAGFNIGGPLEHCPGEIDHDEAKRLLSLACEYLKDTSKAAHRAIYNAKCGAA